MKMRSTLGSAIIAFLMLGAIPPAAAAQGPDPIEYAICVYEERSPAACYPPDELPDPGEPITPPSQPTVPPVNPGQLPPVDPGDPTIPPVDPDDPTIPPVDPGSPTVPSVPSIPGTPDELFGALCMPERYPFGAFCILAQDGQLGPKLTAVRHYLARPPGRGEISETGHMAEDCLHDHPSPDRVARLACIVFGILGQ